MKFNPAKKGEQFENEVEELLIKHNIVYIREGTKVSRGHQSSKGKCDFQLKKYAIECKEIGTLNNLTLPGINRKTKKPYTSTRIQTHQLKYLREQTIKGIVGYLLIKEITTKLYYAVSMKDLNDILIVNPQLRTLKDIQEYGIDLEEFILKLKI